MAKRPIQAFIHRFADSSYGLVVWGGPHNGFVNSYVSIVAAYGVARSCGAHIVYFDCR